jgi:hypothetical protein
VPRPLLTVGSPATYRHDRDCPFITGPIRVHVDGASKKPAIQDSRGHLYVIGGPKVAFRVHADSVTGKVGGKTILAEFFEVLEGMGRRGGIRLSRRERWTAAARVRLLSALRRLIYTRLGQ